MLRKKKGQSTLEYIIILTAVVAAILLVANGVVRTRVQEMITHVGDTAGQAVNQISLNTAR